MLRPRFLWFLLALLFTFPGIAPAWAQDPVKWSAKLEPAAIRAGEGGRVVVSAEIEAPWYIYAPSTPPGGPIITTIELLPSKALNAAGKLTQPKAKRKFDEGFRINTESFSKAVSFGIPVQVSSAISGPQKATVKVRYQTCNDRLCLPPKTVEVPVNFEIEDGAIRPEYAKPNIGVPSQVAQPEVTTSEKGAVPPATGATKAPVTSDAPPTTQKTQNQGILAYAGVAFGAGLLALLTPCVFPMIPLTVAFFTKRNEGQRAGISGPIAFCLGIIGTFTVVGVLISALFGAAGIANFAANPWVNLTLAAVFIVMALNLFGVFEIVVPPAILNRVQPKQGSQGGLLAPVLMGFAFTLTSFTCTVPFVGTALFTAATGGWFYPAIGMLAFSTAFSLPFFLLALFPSWMAKLPRSGQWLISTKAFMGFLELAAALKFISTAEYIWDLGWITRPVFLAIWFTLAMLAGLYLLRVVRLPKDADDTKIGPVRAGIGALTLGVAALLLGAMNGTRLGDIDAYLPPLNYGSASKNVQSLWLKNDLETAQRRAQAENKPLLINFTGYACTNCRLMENNVLPHPTVTSALDKFVAVELFTDGTDAKSREFNQFQQKKFGTIAIPLYAVVEPDGTVRGRLEGLERDPQKFADFLEQSHRSTRIAARQ